MTITLDRGPQDVGDLLRQLNELRYQINYGGPVTTDANNGAVRITIPDEGAGFGGIIRFNGDGHFLEMDMGVDGDLNSGSFLYCDATDVFVGPTGGTNYTIQATTRITAEVPANTAVGGFRAAGVYTTSHAPASAAASGQAGTITWDSSFLYVCVADNTWKRVAIATW